MADAVVELEHVEKNYKNGPAVTRVLHDINLTLESSSFSALVGPSGSGKSTLLNILGLLDHPSSGVLHIAGYETGRLDDHMRTRLRGRALGFIFQFHYLLPAFTALENVVMPLLSEQGRVDSSMRRLGMDLLEQVGVADQADKKANQLSGGQQQRVAVARALVMQPLLVLADEPTGNLDSESGEAVFRLLRRFNRERQVAFLIVTHDERLAKRTDRIITLVDGRIHTDVTPDEAA